MAESHGNELEHGPNVRLFMLVFTGLCLFTAVSFLANWWEHMSPEIGKITPLVVILAVAICKAVLVATYFMHLKWDWSKLFFVIVPVMILGVMMMLVLLPDMVLVWHHEPEHNEPAPAHAKDHH